MKESSNYDTPHRNYVNPNVRESELHKVQDYNVDWDDPFGSDFDIIWTFILPDPEVIKMQRIIRNSEWI
jgi:hypothetical protein